MHRNLIYLTSRDLSQAFELVVPVGGTHFCGRGLPLGFASVIAEGFAAAIAEANDGFYLPVVPYSPGDGVGHLPGSICPEPSGFLAYIDAVVDQAIINEFRRVVLILDGPEGYVVSGECFERNDHPILVVGFASLMSHEDVAGPLAPGWAKQIDVFLGALGLLGRAEQVQAAIARLRTLERAESPGVSQGQFELLRRGLVDAYRRDATRSRMNAEVRFDAAAGQAYIRAVAGKLAGPLGELGRYVRFVRNRPTFKKNRWGGYGWRGAE
ncbi:MAG: creatininase family protein [Phycisphaerae bacterium]